MKNNKLVSRKKVSKKRVLRKKVETPVKTESQSYYGIDEGSTCIARWEQYQPRTIRKLRDFD